MTKSILLHLGLRIGRFCLVGWFYKNSYVYYPILTFDEPIRDYLFIITASDYYGLIYCNIFFTAIIYPPTMFL